MPVSLPKNQQPKHKLDGWSKSNCNHGGGGETKKIRCLIFVFVAIILQLLDDTNACFHIYICFTMLFITRFFNTRHLLEFGIPSFNIIHQEQQVCTTRPRVKPANQRHQWRLHGKNSYEIPAQRVETWSQKSPIHLDLAKTVYQERTYIYIYLYIIHNMIYIYICIYVYTNRVLGFGICTRLIQLALKIIWYNMSEYIFTSRI